MRKLHPARWLGRPEVMEQFMSGKTLTEKIVESLNSESPTGKPLTEEEAKNFQAALAAHAEAFDESADRITAHEKAARHWYRLLLGEKMPRPPADPHDEQSLRLLWQRVYPDDPFKVERRTTTLAFREHPGRRRQRLGTGPPILARSSSGPLQHHGATIRENDVGRDCRRAQGSV